jgi:hypothetical protein
VRTPLAALAATLVLAGCGGERDDDGQSPESEIEQSVRESLVDCKPPPTVECKPRHGEWVCRISETGGRITSTTVVVVDADHPEVSAIC